MRWSFAHMLLLVPFSLSAACTGGDHGPVPAADHQDEVRRVMDRELDARNRLARPSTYRFAAPVRDSVARWHFDKVPEGQPHQFGDRYGWRVDFWVTPHYAGYPPQPESQRMAFFEAGRLRGLFLPGGGSAPMRLDEWEATWVDDHWHAVVQQDKEKGVR